MFDAADCLTAAVGGSSPHDSGHDHGARRIVSPNRRPLVEKRTNQIHKHRSNLQSTAPTQSSDRPEKGGVNSLYPVESKYTNSSASGVFDTCLVSDTTDL